MAIRLDPFHMSASLPALPAWPESACLLLWPAVRGAASEAAMAGFRQPKGGAPDIVIAILRHNVGRTYARCGG